MFRYFVLGFLCSCFLNGNAQIISKEKLKGIWSDGFVKYEFKEDPDSNIVLISDSYKKNLSCTYDYISWSEVDSNESLLIRYPPDDSITFVFHVTKLDSVELDMILVNVTVVNRITKEWHWLTPTSKPALDKFKRVHAGKKNHSIQ